MKEIKKSKKLPIGDNRGETIVEVIVAFALLTIMLVIFSQGLTYASRSDIRAMQTREAADRAMRKLQETKVNNDGRNSTKAQAGSIDVNLIIRQIYTIEDEQSHESFTYIVYSSGD